MPICFAVVPPRPLLQQRVEARLHPFEDRLPPRFTLDPQRLGQPQVAPHGVAADPQLPGGLPPAQTFDQHLVSQHVHVFHSEHPFPQSPRPRRPRCWDTLRNGSPSER